MIKDIEDLVAKVKNGGVVVEWRVLPSIGPDWIGGGRFIDFYFRDKKLAENRFQHNLAQTLIQKLAIPETSFDDHEVFKGEGAITFKDGNLILEYEWYKTLPYMYHHDSGGDEIVFWELTSE
ncbi:MAG: hypothetical protein AAGD96_30015 [Chloroflexota bacterium]